MIKITIPFEGSDEDRARNQESHVWRVIDLEERYGAKGVGKATECQRCKVVADTVAADWPCGKAPNPISLDEYNYMIKNRKRNQ